MAGDTSTGDGMGTDPPGWYPDPWEQTEERWWNGFEWSDRTREEVSTHDEGDQPTGDSGGHVELAEEPAHAGWYPDPRGEADERWWDGTVWTDRTNELFKAGEQPPRMPYKGVVAAIVGMAIVAAIITSGDDDSSTSSSRSGGSPSPSGPAATVSIEEQLATLSDGFPPDDAVVRDYRLALNAAEPVCQQSRRSIGDLAYRGAQAAEGRGIDVTPLDLIRALPEVVPAEQRPTDCTDVVSAVIVLLTP